MNGRLLLMLPALWLAFTACQESLGPVDDTVRLVLRVHDSLPIPGDAPSGFRFETQFFRKANGRLAETAYTLSLGGVIHAQAGRYDMISYNFDTESVLFEGQRDHALLRAVSAPASAAARALFEEVLDRAGVALNAPVALEPVVGEPGRLLVARLESLNLPLRHEGDPEVVLTADAWPVVIPCRLKVEGIQGLENLSSAVGFLTGMVRGRYLGTGKPVGAAVLRFPLKKDDDASVLVARFTSFGCMADTPHWLYLLLTDTEGVRYLFSYDLTTRCLPAATELDFTLSLDFTVPEPNLGGGGFIPSSDDWQGVKIPIYI